MSESYYWPGEDQPGEYLVEKDTGVFNEWLWNGSEWRRGMYFRTTQQMVEHGYIGVRREQKPIDERDALLRESIADFRANVKQPTKAADWAFKWVGRFIEAVES